MSSTEASAPATTSAPISPEELEQALLKQIDFYFSRQNLSNDAYLVSQMNNQMFVPIEVVANFRKIRERTTDINLLVKVMRSSSAVQVDETSKLVRPSFTIQRSTIILRDIPSAAPEATVRGLFAEPHASRVSSVRSDIGDTWFVSFENETNALEALEHLRTRTFEDKPIKARLKSENLLKSVGAPAAPAFVPQYTPGTFYPGSRPHAHDDARRGARGARGPQNRGHRGSRDFTEDATKPRQPRPSTTLTATSSPVLGAAPATTEPAPILAGPLPAAAKGKGRQFAAKGNKPSIQVPAKTSLVVTAADFPPLPNKPIGGSSPTRSGFEGSFLKYDKDELIAITQAMSDLKRPVSLPTHKDCAVVSDTPNTHLEITKPLPKNEKGQDKVPVDAVKSFAQAAITAKSTSPVQQPSITLVPTAPATSTSPTPAAPEKKDTHKKAKSAKSGKPAESGSSTSPAPQESEEDGFQVQSSRKNRPKKTFPLLGPSVSKSSDAPAAAATTTTTTTTATAAPVNPEPVLKEVKETTTSPSTTESSEDASKKSWSTIVGKQQKQAKSAASEPAAPAPTSAPAPAAAEGAAQ